MKISNKTQIQLNYSMCLSRYSETYQKFMNRQLAEYSRTEGVSMNQYCVYLLSMNSVLRKEIFEASQKKNK